MEAILKRNEVTGMGEPMTNRRFKDILVMGFTDEYDAVKFQIYRDSSSGLDDIQKTMRNLYLDAKPRSSGVSGRIAGRGALISTESVACCNCSYDQHAPRGVAMSAASEVCHHRNNQGYYKRNYPELQEEGQAGDDQETLRGKGWIWRRRRADVVLATQHDHALLLRMLRTRGAAPTAGQRLRSFLHAVQSPFPDGGARKLAVNFGQDFDGGFLLTRATTSRTFLPKVQETGTPVDVCTTKLAPSAVRGLVRTTIGFITTVVTGIITIGRSIWELVTHRSAVNEKKTLSASGGSTFATMTKGPVSST